MKIYLNLLMVTIANAFVVSAAEEINNSSGVLIPERWGSQVIYHWNMLSTNVQLAIQLLTVLIIFYILTCVFKCKKGKSCLTTCKCGCVGKCDCSDKKENFMCPCNCGCKEEVCHDALDGCCDECTCNECVK